jgi:hypothetical protein
MGDSRDPKVKVAPAGGRIAPVVAEKSSGGRLSITTMSVLSTPT